MSFPILLSWLFIIFRGVFLKVFCFLHQVPAPHLYDTVSIPPRLALQPGHEQAYHFKCDCNSFIPGFDQGEAQIKIFSVKCFVSMANMLNVAFFFTFSLGTTWTKTRTLWPMWHSSCTACRYAKLWFTYKERRWYTGMHIRVLWKVGVLFLYIYHPVLISSIVLTKHTITV